MQALKNVKSSPNDKKLISKIIRNQPDYIEKEDLIDQDKKVKRLESLLKMEKNNELSIEKLTIEEQNEFKNFLTNEKEIKHYIKEWIPWWDFQEVNFIIILKLIIIIIIC